MTTQIPRQQLVGVLNINNSINIKIPNADSFIITLDGKPDIIIPISIFDFDMNDINNSDHAYFGVMGMINKYASVKMIDGDEKVKKLAEYVAEKISNYVAKRILFNILSDHEKRNNENQITKDKNSASADVAMYIQEFEAAAASSSGGKRSSSKSRKTQLRDEHGRFLPSNKRKMVRRKTARRTMQKSTNPMNTIMTTTLV